MGVILKMGTLWSSCLQSTRLTEKLVCGVEQGPRLHGVSGLFEGQTLKEQSHVGLQILTGL